jgi:hypothetical protein
MVTPEEERAIARKVVERIVERWDLAPKGTAEAVKAHWSEPGSPALADAIRALYAPLFAEAAAEVDE